MAGNSMAQKGQTTIYKVILPKYNIDLKIINLKNGLILKNH